jgi:hypothetical protein
MKLSSKHRKTLEKVRQRPRPSGLRWQDMEAMLIALGFERVQGKGSAVMFLKPGADPWGYHRPHGKSSAVMVNKGAINSLDSYLNEKGFYEELH